LYSELTFVTIYINIHIVTNKSISTHPFLYKKTCNPPTFSHSFRPPPDSYVNNNTLLPPHYKILLYRKSQTISKPLGLQNKLKLERIKQRVIVIACLKNINDRRISEEGRRRSKRRRFIVDGGNNREVYISDQTLNGVLAEEKIAAFEMWREIIMYL